MLRHLVCPTFRRVTILSTLNNGIGALLGERMGANLAEMGLGLGTLEGKIRLGLFKCGFFQVVDEMVS